MSIEGKLRYRNWLKDSEWWETLRLECLGWQQMTCRGCGCVSERNHVHHLRYRKTWELTGLHELRVLCKICHKLIHEMTTPESYQGMTEAILAFNKAILVIRNKNGITSPKILSDLENAGLKHLIKHHPRKKPLEPIPNPELFHKTEERRRRLKSVEHGLKLVNGRRLNRKAYKAYREL